MSGADRKIPRFSPLLRTITKDAAVAHRHPYPRISLCTPRYQYKRHLCTRNILISNPGIHMVHHYWRRKGFCMMGFAAGTQNTSVLLVPFRTPPMKCQLSSTVEVIDSRLFHWMQEAQLACRILTVKHF